LNYQKQKSIKSVIEQDAVIQDIELKSIKQKTRVRVKNRYFLF